MKGRAYALVAFLAALGTISASRPLAAQELKTAVRAEIGSGLQGGGEGPAGSMTRARTTVRLGFDAYVDEFPKDVFRVAALVEVEPKTGFGADLEYMRRLSRKLWVHGGPTAILAPSSLYGAQGGCTFAIPIGSQAAITLGPTVRAYFLGADLPDGTVIVQGMFFGGVRADL